MAPTPKKKHTSSRTGKREHGKAKKFDTSKFTKCPSCGKLRLSHKTCANCGYTYTKKRATS